MTPEPVLSQIMNETQEVSIRHQPEEVKTAPNSNRTLFE